MFWGRRLRIRQAAVIAVCLAAVGCGPRRAGGAPAIQFSTIPGAAAGGADQIAPIAGRVADARAGQRIVIFAKSSVGVWWVQPLAAEPFTPIEGDSTWHSTVHLGIEYAALLVEPGYRPPATTEELPQAGGQIVAVARVKGTGTFVPPAPKRITFSGYEWDIRQVPSERGGTNDYSADNAWVDADGLLHLKLRQQGDKWTSAQVAMTRSLGYGTYVFVVRDASQLDPAAALCLFTYDNLGADQNHRELGIEISQWGDRSISTAQFVIQPFYVPANVVRFDAPPGGATFSFRWEPGKALFKAVRGPAASAGQAVVAQHEFTAGVPIPGNERAQMTLYFFRSSPSPPQHEVEVVIERFQYLP